MLNSNQSRNTNTDWPLIFTYKFCLCCSILHDPVDCLEGMLRECTEKELVKYGVSGEWQTLLIAVYCVCPLIEPWQEDTGGWDAAATKTTPVAAATTTAPSTTTTTSIITTIITTNGEQNDQAYTCFWLFEKKPYCGTVCSKCAFVVVYSASLKYQH